MHKVPSGPPLLLALVVVLIVALAACGSDRQEDKKTAAGQPEQSRPAAPAASSAAVAGQSSGSSSELSSVSAAAGSAAEGTGQTAAAPEKEPALPPASAAQKAAANALLDFYNAAARTLTSGWYGLPEVLQANVLLYLEEWQLLRMPEPREKRGDAARRLKPLKDAFSPEEEKELTGQQAQMDRALDAMLRTYKELEEYVADGSIQDDGVKGRALAQELSTEHAAFVAAREKYMAVVESHATAAEELVLRDHPLRRQIMAAERVFSLMRQSARLLAAAKPDREAVLALQQEMEAQLALGGKPPFQAIPDLERLYRAFLKQAAAFPRGLARGANEGFYSPLRNELNNVAQRSRHAYNSFVKAANMAEAL